MPYDNSAVRRQDRLLDEARARELLAGGRFGVLSLVDGDGAYGIPVNYVWDGDDSLYVHCAPDGRKLRCIDRRDRVSFCVVGATEVCPAQFTTAYESIQLDSRARRGLRGGARRAHPARGAQNHHRAPGPAAEQRRERHRALPVLPEECRQLRDLSDLAL